MQRWCRKLRVCFLVRSTKESSHESIAHPHRGRPRPRICVGLSQAAVSRKSRTMCGLSSQERLSLRPIMRSGFWKPVTRRSITCLRTMFEWTFSLQQQVGPFASLRALPDTGLSMWALSDPSELRGVIRTRSPHLQNSGTTWPSTHREWTSAGLVKNESDRSPEISMGDGYRPGS